MNTKYILLLPLFALACGTPEAHAKFPPTARAQAHTAPGAVAGASAQASVESRLARGRELLASGRAAQAQSLFEQAAEQDQQSLRTRTWVIRSWMAQGRINDSLDAIDALERAGEKGPAIDYLYGMAFVAKARDYTGKNVPGQIIQMSYVDAVGFLEQATKADPDAYRDAFLPLAEAAWQMRELDIARAAADRAVAIEPENAEAALLLGRIALAQFAAETADASRKAAADAHWDAARTGFQQAIDLTAGATQPAERALAAQAHNQLGHTWLWRQQIDAAGQAYAGAAALDPTAVSFTQMLGALGPEQFHAALESAAKRFTELWGAETPADAALLWWLGYARFQQQQYEEAEEAFTGAVVKVPSFYNSWWYTALTRYHREDYAGAIAAIRKNWEANPEDIVASVAQQKEIAVPILTYLVGWCSREEQQVEAGLVCEILANVEPEKSDHWNNAGLFWRDAGEELVQQGRKPEDRALALQYFEKAYAFYLRALEMEPENPGFLNDTAVMLHYNLDRDLDRALELYKKATVNARAELAKPDLPPDRQEWFQIALRDSRNNTRLLEEALARRKQ